MRQEMFECTIAKGGTQIWATHPLSRSLSLSDTHTQTHTKTQYAQIAQGGDYDESKSIFTNFFLRLFLYLPQARLGTHQTLPYSRQESGSPSSSGSN